MKLSFSVLAAVIALDGRVVRGGVELPSGTVKQFFELVGIGSAHFKKRFPRALVLLASLVSSPPLLKERMNFLIGSLLLYAIGGIVCAKVFDLLFGILSLPRRGLVCFSTDLFMDPRKIFARFPLGVLCRFRRLLLCCFHDLLRFVFCGREVLRAAPLLASL